MLRLTGWEVPMIPSNASTMSGKVNKNRNTTRTCYARSRVSDSGQS